jgi:hypothetical protein
VALYGVIMDGENARAFIRTRPTDKEIHVGIDDVVGCWKVSQIKGQRLVLSLDGRLATFILTSGNTANSARQPWYDCKTCRQGSTNDRAKSCPPNRSKATRYSENDRWG